MESTVARPGHHPGPSHSWIKCPHPKPAAVLRLVCFAHAGGSAAVYHPWGRMFPPAVEVWAIELPGHGSRIRETAETRLERLAATIAAELVEVGLAERPFAFFGHSMGGLLAFEVARVLRAVAGPRHFFASGCHAPQLGFSDTPIHTLPPADFLAVMVARYGGIPEAILREQELLDLVLPTLRADMAMVETHRYEPGPPFSCPMTVMAGVDDVRATEEVLSGWAHQTTGAFELLRFPGGHFYLQPGIREVVAEVGSRLAQLSEPS